MLSGFIPDVPLNCGDVVTYANLYVGNKAPFDLLLGRPWQRGNFVSIDERIDGTYLQLKNKFLQVNYEVLVTPDKEVDPEIADYIARTTAALASEASKPRTKTHACSRQASSRYETFVAILPPMGEYELEGTARIEEKTVDATDATSTTTTSEKETFPTPAPPQGDD